MLVVMIVFVVGLLVRVVLMLVVMVVTVVSILLERDALAAYPKDPQIVSYPLATLKWSHALTRWTCSDFFFTE